ncbi:MAG: WD40 repeat domain-containing protein [Spirochaetota bacterium]|nr:WD40 repeat domain-containing protein [Spirochaetota bacterium]
MRFIKLILASQLLLFTYTIDLYSIDLVIVKEVSVTNDAIISLAVSNDESLVAVGTESGFIKIITLATGVTKELGRHEARVNDLAWSSDNKYLYTASSDTSVKRWTVSSGVTQTMRDHNSPVFSVAVDPGGKWIASSASDMRIILWSPEFNEIKTLTRHKESVWALRFNPDGKLIASAGGQKDNVVHLWKHSTGQVKTMSKHKAGVNTVSFSQSGGFVLSGSMDHSVILWDITKEKTISKSIAAKPVWQADFYTSDSDILVSHRDRDLHHWNTVSGRAKRVFRHANTITCFYFQPKNSMIYLGDNKGKLIILKDIDLRKPKTNLTSSDDVKLKVLSVKNSATNSPETSFKIRISANQPINKVLILNMEASPKSFSYQLAGKKSVIEISESVSLSEGINHFYVLILTDKGITGNHFLISRPKG